MQSSSIRMGNANDCTLTGWINVQGCTANNPSNIGPYKKSNTYYWALYAQKDWGSMVFRYKTTASNTAKATLALQSAGWFHYAVAITKKSSVALYINGEYKGEQSLPTEGYYTYSDPLSLYLSGRPGYLDETRIRDTLSSADWIKAEYDSVNNSDFIVASSAVRNSGGFILVVQ